MLPRHSPNESHEIVLIRKNVLQNECCVMVWNEIVNKLTVYLVHTYGTLTQSSLKSLY